MGPTSPPPRPLHKLLLLLEVLFFLAESLDLKDLTVTGKVKLERLLEQQQQWASSLFLQGLQESSLSFFFSLTCFLIKADLAYLNTRIVNNNNITDREIHIGALPLLL